MPYSERVEDALILAARLHQNQTRKQSEVPYLTHLLAVAATVGENGGTEDEFIAALLHDAIEDQGGSAVRDLLRHRFGDNVTRIVDGCSDTDQTPKPPWRQRKEAYLRHLAEADASIRLVSMADKLHNARSTLTDLRRYGDTVWTRFNGGREGTLWYYRSLADFFCAVEDRPLAQELCDVVDELDKTANAMQPAEQSP